MAQTYQSISQTTLGAGATSVTLSSIPSTYSHLELFIESRTAYADVYDDMAIRFNGDVASNYAYITLYARATTLEVGRTGSSEVYTGYFLTSAANNTANRYGLTRIFIPEYKNTSVAKTGFIAGHGCSGVNSKRAIGYTSMYWNSTSAINSITILSLTNSNILAGSTFSLYGITKA